MQIHLPSSASFRSVFISTFVRILPPFSANPVQLPPNFNSFQSTASIGNIPHIFNGRNLKAEFSCCCCCCCCWISPDRPSSSGRTTVRWWTLLSALKRRRPTSLVARPLIGIKQRCSFEVDSWTVCQLPGHSNKMDDPHIQPLSLSLSLLQQYLSQFPPLPLPPPPPPPRG